MMFILIKLTIIFATLLVTFFLAEKRNWILISLLFIILTLEGLSMLLEYRRNVPEFVFVSQKRHFDEAKNPTSAKFTLEFKNLGGRKAKNISVNIKLFCGGELVKENALNAKDKMSHQSIFLRVTFPEKACNDVFQNNKAIDAEICIKHNEGIQTIWLKFRKDPEGLEETKWKEFKK